MSLKTKLNNISISSIILRTDNPKLNEQGSEVNVHLKELCEEKNILLTIKRTLNPITWIKVNFI